MAEPILVTGGAGFIGSNFVYHWRRYHPDDPILVLDKLTYAGDLRNLEGVDGLRFVQGDVCDAGLVADLMARHALRRLVHFAAESHVDNSIAGPSPFVQSNVVGTFVMLEAARRAWSGDPSARFLHVSTDEVFGSLGATGLFREDSPYDPRSPYSATKAASDHLVRAYVHTYGFPATVTHCSNNFGPRQHGEKLLPRAILAMAQGRPVPVYGDGLQVRDWLFVGDHCEALDLALRAAPGETYCLGGRNEWRNLDLLKLLGRLVDAHLGRSAGTAEALLTFVPDRPGHDRRYAIDPTKAERELGWTQRTPFTEGLRRTVEWYLPK